MSPALAGGFLTTAPPGEPYIYFFFFFFKYLFVYLVVPVLNCGMHVGSSSLTRDRIQAPCIGSAVLSTAPPGKSPCIYFLKEVLPQKYRPGTVLTSHNTILVLPDENRGHKGKCPQELGWYLV